MELKNYQHQTLRDLDDYIHILNESHSLSEAFNRYWEECRGVSIHNIDNNYLRPYINTIQNVPRVTLKVPTAGGKTFIACNAIGRIFQSLQIGDFPKVVALHNLDHKAQFIFRHFFQHPDCFLSDCCHRQIHLPFPDIITSSSIYIYNIAFSRTIYNQHQKKIYAFHL